MIYDHTPCQLGEGPLWHPVPGNLFWGDILSQHLYRKGQQWQFDRPVSAIGWINTSAAVGLTANGHGRTFATPTRAISQAELQVIL